MNCAHENGRRGRDKEGRYACLACGTIMCTDCGCRPVWWHGDSGYCRDCHVKNGHSVTIEVEIDDDFLRVFGGNKDRAGDAVDALRNGNFDELAVLFDARNL